MSAVGVDYPGQYADFLAWFGEDAACLDYLDWLRWPDGHLPVLPEYDALEGG